MDNDNDMDKETSTNPYTAKVMTDSSIPLVDTFQAGLNAVE